MAVHLDGDRWHIGRNDKFFVLAVLGYFLLWQGLTSETSAKASHRRRWASKARLRRKGPFRAAKRFPAPVAFLVRVARGLRSWAQ